MAIRDAETTRIRIRDAAIREFSRYGFAGGRVERIATSASTNVRMIYAYYGSKDGLFDAALQSVISTMAEAVPPDPLDLPAWAGRLFDYHQEHPEALRINMWAQLERPQSVSEPMSTYLTKTSTVNDTNATTLSAVDLLVIVYAVAQAWFLTPTGLIESDGSSAVDPVRIVEHRTAVMTVVESIVQGAGRRTPA